MLKINKKYFFCRKNSLLGDEMGLGKTIQTITFLQGVYDIGIHGPFLIVVPLSTLHNWEREFESWTNMNVVVYHGSAASRELIQEYELYYKVEPKVSETRRRQKAFCKPIFLQKKHVAKFDVLLTTFEVRQQLLFLSFFIVMRKSLL